MSPETGIDRDPVGVPDRLQAGHGCRAARSCRPAAATCGARARPCCGVSPAGSTLTDERAGAQRRATWRIAGAEHPPLDRTRLLAERVQERERDGPPTQRRERHAPAVLVAQRERRAARWPGGHVAWPCNAGSATGSARRRAGQLPWNATPIAIPTIAAAATPATNQRRCIRTRRDAGATSHQYTPTTISRPDWDEERQQRAGQERGDHGISLGRRVSVLTASLLRRHAPVAGSSQRNAATKRTMQYGTEPGTHITPAASCWSASAESPPGRCASAA